MGRHKDRPKPDDLYMVPPQQIDEEKPSGGGVIAGMLIACLLVLAGCAFLAGRWMGLF